MADRTELDLHRPRPHWSALVTTLVKGVDLAWNQDYYYSNEKIIIYIYTYRRSFVRNRRYRIEFNPWRSFFHEIILQYSLARDWDLEAFPQKMNLIRGTRSRGLKNISRGRGACEPSWREYARQGRTGWPSLDMVCLHSATMRRSSVFHGNYRRARSSMPFVHRLISLSTYFPCLQSFSPRKKHDQGVIHGDRWSLAWWKKEKGMIYNRRCMVVRLRRRIQFSKIAFLPPRPIKSNHPI